jgi:hypothetical protein
MNRTVLIFSRLQSVHTSPVLTSYPSHNLPSPHIPVLWFSQGCSQSTHPQSSPHTPVIICQSSYPSSLIFSRLESVHTSPVLTSYPSHNLPSPHIPVLWFSQGCSQSTHLQSSPHTPVIISPVLISQFSYPNNEDWELFWFSQGCQSIVVAHPRCRQKVRVVTKPCLATVMNCLFHALIELLNFVG